jgi:hypothetical protein
MASRGQPDQRPPPIRWILLALQQPLTFEMGDDLADHRLRPVQVGRRFAHGERPGQR